MIYSYYLRTLTLLMQKWLAQLRKWLLISFTKLNTILICLALPNLSYFVDLITKFECKKINLFLILCICHYFHVILNMFHSV